MHRYAVQYCKMLDDFSQVSTSPWFNHNNEHFFFLLRIWLPNMKWKISTIAYPSIATQELLTNELELLKWKRKHDVSMICSFSEQFRFGCRYFEVGVSPVVQSTVPVEMGWIFFQQRRLHSKSMKFANISSCKLVSIIAYTPARSSLYKLLQC